MNTMYCPKNIDQPFSLIIYPNNVYLLLETELEKEQPMYMGKDRIKMEAILKFIKKEADKKQYEKTILKVYTLSEDGIKYTPQSPFYSILPSK
jgi:hypothetical protein